MRLLILVVLAAHAAALYMTASTQQLFEAVPAVTVFNNVQPIPTVSGGISSEPITEQTSSIPFSALITIAPLSPNPLEIRQRCFDDRGFSVNCAQWTGYYYTWGGAGHPYAGGPGDGGGSGSNSNRVNGATTHTGLSKSTGSLWEFKWPSIVALATVSLVYLL